MSEASGFSASQDRHSTRRCPDTGRKDAGQEATTLGINTVHETLLGSALQSDPFDESHHSVPQIDSHQARYTLQ